MDSRQAARPEFRLLRDVIDADPPIFFEFQRDPVAARTAAFVSKDPSDRAAFDAHWKKIRSDPKVILRTIVQDGRVVGSVARWDLAGNPQVTYWIDRKFRGRGIATRALAAFLKIVTVRPIYASAAHDDAASIRVLEKCGFRRVGGEKAFANARGCEIEEVFFEL